MKNIGALQSHKSLWAKN